MRPLIGMRAKLYARGSGKWAKSGGEAAKFGLTTPEMLEAVKILKSKKMLDCLVMLHFHIGSQITDIRKIKEAIREAGRVYAKLRGLGVPIQYLNLGGGLGVDYDGSKTAFDSSMNYSVQEYANDVVYTIKQICDEEKVPPPTLVTESGRAVTAYHSVFVTNVLDVADRIEQGTPRARRRPATRTSSRSSPSIYETVNAKNLRESYHDALQYKEELFTLFNLGHLSLEDRSQGRDPLLADLRKDPQGPEDAQGDPGRVRGHGDDARGQVRPELLGLPVAPGHLGDRPALPDPADPPPEREARPSSARSPTSPATPTARSRSSSTCATSRRPCRSTRSATASPTTSASA